MSGLIHEKDKSNSSPFEKQSTFQWSYQGVEQYNIGAPTTSNTENHSPVTPNNLTGTAEVTKQRNSPDSSSSPEEDVPEETFNTDTNYRETIDTNECDENGGLTISVKTVEIKGTEEIKINVEENSDLPAASLDMISKGTISFDCFLDVQFDVFLEVQFDVFLEVQFDVFLGLQFYVFHNILIFKYTCTI